MREGIGSISLYNIIIIFIAVVFAILSATLSYSKAFKVNSNIIRALEIYEGYNAQNSVDKNGSAEEIDRVLSTLGYRVEQNSTCPTLNGTIAESKLANNYMYNFCLYLKREDTKDYNGRYFTYKVRTYMYFDVPLLGGLFRIPITTSTEKIFCFGEATCNERLGDY